ncbi:hypothetical protein BGZ63DRAFT_459418 [Mariannaea sp. PMI_226]|nr:hypothetical protein BGZ63DRAFT_459418 [Mariannaea sp. PMI_226]
MYRLPGTLVSTQRYMDDGHKYPQLDDLGSYVHLYESLLRKQGGISKCRSDSSEIPGSRRARAVTGYEEEKHQDHHTNRYLQAGYQAGRLPDYLPAKFTLGSATSVSRTRPKPGLDEDYRPPLSSSILVERCSNSIRLKVLRTLGTYLGTM